MYLLQWAPTYNEISLTLSNFLYTFLHGNSFHFRIDKDVQRCDRNLSYFTDKNLEKLRNVITTYVWENLDIGYMQVYWIDISCYNTLKIISIMEYNIMWLNWIGISGNVWSGWSTSSRIRRRIYHSFLFRPYDGKDDLVSIL